MIASSHTRKHSQAWQRRARRRRSCSKVEKRTIKKKEQERRKKKRRKFVKERGKWKKIYRQNKMVMVHQYFQERNWGNCWDEHDPCYGLDEPWLRPIGFGYQVIENNEQRLRTTKYFERSQKEEQRTDDQSHLGACINKRGHLDVWRVIFSFVEFSEYNNVYLRMMCTLFRDIIKPPPLWASFPQRRSTCHYSSLSQMFDIFSKQPKDSQPKLVLIHPGQWRGRAIRYKSDCTKKSITIDMDNSITICGSGRHKTNILSSFTILGNDSDTVILKECTLSNGTITSSDYNDYNHIFTSSAAISMKNMVLSEYCVKIGTYVFSQQKPVVGDKVVCNCMFEDWNYYGDDTSYEYVQNFLVTKVHSDGTYTIQEILIDTTRPSYKERVAIKHTLENVKM